MRTRIRLHWSKFSKLGAIYITKKGQKWLELRLGRLQASLKSARIAIHNLLGIPIPYELRQFALQRALGKANRQALKTHTPVKFPGRATLFRSAKQIDDPTISYSGCIQDRDYGWGQLAEGGIEVREVEGDHISMFKEPYIQSLAAAFDECLERALAKVRNDKK